MVVLAGDMNGHVRISNAGYDGMHGGSGYGDRNADGSRILEYADDPLPLCNTLFVKQESQLVTYAAGPVKNTGRRKLRFVTPGSYEMKNVCRSINC